MFLSIDDVFDYFNPLDPLKRLSYIEGILVKL